MDKTGKKLKDKNVLQLKDIFGKSAYKGDVMKATSFSDYLENRDKVTEIDISNFSKVDIKKLTEELELFDELPGFKVTGLMEYIHKDEKEFKDSFELRGIIYPLLGLVEFQLTKEEQNALREAFEEEKGDFDSYLYGQSSGRDSYVITDLNLGMELPKGEEHIDPFGEEDNVNPLNWAITKRKCKKARMYILRKFPELLYEKDKNGDVPATVAADYGDESFLMFMVANHPNVLKARNNNGETPALLAAERKLETALMLMMQKDSSVIHNKDKHGAQLALVVLDKKLKKALNFMIENHSEVLRIKSDYGSTLATETARKGLEDILILIIKSDPSVIYDQDKSWSDYTLAMWAA